jgi:hypothetical protein
LCPYLSPPCGKNSERRIVLDGLGLKGIIYGTLKGYRILMICRTPLLIFHEFGVLGIRPERKELDFGVLGNV